ncbi:MAG TPA: trypsin-like peptidase domain-containing protein [Vicinamibacteria bacterium]|nr:trypsin-like peptidase domain-containing protein [Vicinamibacteria bacterium]
MPARDRSRIRRAGMAALGGVALLWGGAEALPPAERRPAADAMAFIRVVGDLNVRFTEVFKPSYVRKNVEVGTGSGFVIAPSGLVLTNRHVVRDEPVRRVIDGSEAEVTLESKRIAVAVGPGGAVAVLDGAVVAEDAELDLAVLQVTAADLPYLPFGDSDAVDPGRPVQVLGFPFGRQVEVGRRSEGGVVPQVTVTAGSLSAAREDEEGGRRYLQTDAAVQPGNSGGPMLDEEGYAVGVVRMKLARDATAAGAGFGIPINLVKDFLDAHGLLGLMPVARLRPGVVHSLDWKGLRVELPDGFQDSSPTRLGVATGETGDGISFRLDRVATSWDREALEGAVLGGRLLPGFLPEGAASPVRQAERGRPARRVGTAVGTLPDGQPFRLEYAVMSLKGEAIVARFLGPPDALAFNLGLLRRALETLEAGRLLTAEVDRPLAPPFEAVALPAVEGGRVAMPAGWSVEPAATSACGRVPPADSGLAASPPGDFTVVFRALRWPGADGALEAAVRACGGSSWSAAAASGNGVSAAYSGRLDRLGSATEARGVLVQRGGESLLLEIEAPVAKTAFVDRLHERWVSEVARAGAAMLRGR